MYTPSLQELIAQLNVLPGIGPKTAQRLALFILKKPKDYAESLSKAILQAKKNVGLCQSCFNLSDVEICHICSNPKRDQSLICVIPDSRDLVAIEKTHEWRGTYHVLGGLFSPMDGIGPEELNCTPLIQRAANSETKEVVLAIPPSVEGETTTLYLAELLKPFVKVTRIAYGLSVGSDLDYADQNTIVKAIDERITLSSKPLVDY